MITSLNWSDRIKLKRQEEIHKFLQQMLNRLIVGNLRYGEPNRRKKYFSKAIFEIKAYKKTGNREHLLNIANYCILESLEPENIKFHFDNTVESVTRGRI